MQEDIILLSEYLLNSSHWSKISEKLRGRNIYSIKNRFNSLLAWGKIEKNSVKLNEEIKSMLNDFKEKNLKKLHTEEDTTMPYLKPSFKLFSSSLCKNHGTLDCNFFHIFLKKLLN